MQRGEATLPTATPFQTCPSCCTSLPMGSLPTGIPQQPWPSRQQRPVHSRLPPAMPGDTAFSSPVPSTFSCLRAQQSRVCSYRCQVDAEQRGPSKGGTPTAGTNPQTVG